MAVGAGNAHEGVADAAIFEEEHREQQADAVVQGDLLLSHQAQPGPASRAEEAARPCRQAAVWPVPTTSQQMAATLGSWDMHEPAAVVR